MEKGKKNFIISPLLQFFSETEWVENQNNLTVSRRWNTWEERYLAWEYIYEGKSVNTDEEYVTLEWKAEAPEGKLYIWLKNDVN